MTAVPANRAERRRMRRVGGLAGVTLVASSGFLGGYLGNPRLPRSYAAGIQCGADVTTGALLNDAITLFNTTACDTIVIDGDVTVDGTGVTDVAANGKDFILTGKSGTYTLDKINGGSNHQILNVTLDGSHTVQVSNVTLYRGLAQNLNGGAVSVLSTDPVTIEGANLSSNAARGTGGNGGAVYARGDVTLRQSTVQDNDANAGGAIYSQGSVSVQDAGLYSNTSYNGDGGAIYASADVTVTGISALNDNLANSQQGGAIYSGGSVRVTGAYFARNGRGRGESSPSADGGAIYAADGDVTVEESFFHDNRTTGSGGAVYVGTGYTLTARYSTFVDNVATSYGGALYSHENLVISHSSFTGNSTTSRDGGAAYGKVSDVSYSTFEANSSGRHGGGMFAQRGSFTNVTFVGNSALGFGGGLRLSYQSNSVAYSMSFLTFSGNSAYRGGGLYHRGRAGWFLSNSIFSANAATDSGNDTRGPQALDARFSLFTDVASSAPAVGGSNNLFGPAALEPIGDNGGFQVPGPSGPTTIRTMLPGAGSPAIDAGDPAFTGPPDSDERGAPYLRKYGSAVDMGAVETQPTPTPTPPSPPPAAATYTVTYEANGASGGSVPGSTGPYSGGDVVTVSSNSGTLTRTGYTFVGWNTLPDGSGLAFAPGATFSIVADAVLYAQWAPVTVPTTPPAPVTPPSTPPPGGSVVTEGGTEIPSTTKPNAGGTAVEEKDAGGATTVGGLDPNGNPSRLGPQGELLVTEGTKVTVTGTGYQPGSKVAVYILNPSITLCVLTADANGGAAGVCDFPGTLPPGGYLLQAAGFTPNGDIRTVSMPLKAIANPKVVTKRLKATVYFASMSPRLDATDKRILDALMRKVPTSAQKVTVQSLGFVQPVGGVGNDDSLSTARATNTARYLKSEGLKGSYYVSGRGRAKESGSKARRVEVTVSYTITR